MIKTIIILPLLFATSYAFNLRIVHGQDALPGEFPFAVSLRRNIVDHTCGGTILNEKFILTAAHCVCLNNQPQNASNYSVQYGSVNISADLTRSIPVKKIHCNNFNISNVLFDSAVLELDCPIPPGEDWTTVKLSKEFDTTVPQKGEIIGWGRIYETEVTIPVTLQKLSVDIYPDSVCDLFATFNAEHHICFGSDAGGACNGDSGGALISAGQQVGIASFITATCGVATSRFPNVYSRVSRYFDWIEDIAGPC